VWVLIVSCGFPFGSIFFFFWLLLLSLITPYRCWLETDIIQVLTSRQIPVADLGQAKSKCWLGTDIIQVLTWDRDNPGPDLRQTESRSWLETDRKMWQGYCVCCKINYVSTIWWSGPGLCLSQVSTWIMSVPIQHLDYVCLKSGPEFFCLSQVRTWILSVPSQDLDSVCLKSGPGFCLSRLETDRIQVLIWDRHNPGPDLRQIESRFWLETDIIQGPDLRQT
jgi:hypothetical protein